MHLGVVKNIDMAKELSKYAEEDGFKTVAIIDPGIKIDKKYLGKNWTKKLEQSIMKLAA